MRPSFGTMRPERRGERTLGETYVCPCQIFLLFCRRYLFVSIGAGWVFAFLYLYFGVRTRNQETLNVHTQHVTSRWKETFS